MSRRKNETSVPWDVALEAQRLNAEMMADYPDRCPNCGFHWPLPGRHRCPPETLAEFTGGSP